MTPPSSPPLNAPPAMQAEADAEPEIPPETTTSFRQSARDLPGVFWVLILGTFINRFGTFVMPFLPLYLIGKGWTETEAGVALTSFAVGAIVSTLAGGWLADRLGRNVTMALSLTVGAVLYVGMACAESHGAVILLTGLAGLTGEAMVPACSAMVGDLAGPEHRVAAFGFFRLAINAGFAIGPAVGGWLAGKSFFSLFIADAASSAIFGLLALFFLPRGTLSTGHEASWAPAFAAVRKARPFLAMGLGCLVLNLALRQSVGTLSLDAARLGYSTTQIGLLFTINGLMIILFELPLLARTSRWPESKAISWGFAIIGIGLAANALPATPWRPALSMAVLTLGEMLALSRTAAFCTKLAPVPFRGRFLGVLSLCWWLGNIGGSAPGLALYSHHPDVLWLACGLCGLLGAAIVGWGARLRPERRRN